MSRLRIGIIGGGGIATAHLPQLARRADAVELVAMADINPAAKALADQYNIARFASDYREILPDVDAVLINVPTHVHAGITIDALRAGKHVFVEKPMTRTWEDAKRVASAAAAAAAESQSKGALQIGFVRRFDQEWLAFRSVIQQRRIGKPVIWRDIAAGAGPSIKWFLQDEQGGGPFIDGLIHNYDFALYTFGPAEWAMASLRTINPKNTAFDSGAATIRFASGDELIVAWTWGMAPGAHGGRIFEFYSPEGSLRWEADKPGQFSIVRGDARELVTYPPKSLHEAYDLQMDEFIAVAQGKAKPRAGLAEGLESMRLSLAVLQSGREGRKVHLSEFQ